MMQICILSFIFWEQNIPASPLRASVDVKLFVLIHFCSVSCFSDPPPLYNHERGFVSGVTPHYLLLTNRSAVCAAGRNVKQTNAPRSYSSRKYTLVGKIYILIYHMCFHVHVGLAPSFGCVHLQPEAMSACDDEEGCTFLVWEMTQEEPVLFCSGSLRKTPPSRLVSNLQSADQEWERVTKKEGSFVGVKPSEFE